MQDNKRVRVINRKVQSSAAIPFQKVYGGVLLFSFAGRGCERMRRLVLGGSYRRGR